MKFGYKKVPAPPSEAFPKRAYSYYPLIPIGIEYKGNTTGYEALVDSGADWNVFPAVLGEVIGIDVPTGKKQEFGGIGGKST